MTHPDPLARAERFVWLTGRLLERRRFEYLFRSGSPDAVYTALCAYQNPDGGFGHALEPDARGPVSQPLHTLFALRVLDEIGRCSGPVVTGICEYLASISAPDGGVPNAHPSLRDYPRAPWWRIEDDAPGSLLPTAAIVGLLHKNKVDHPWVDTATEFCWKALAALADTHPYEVEACVPFLDHVPDRDRAEQEADRLGRIVREHRLVVLDPDRPEEAYQPPGYAPGEVHHPYDYAREPASLARRWFSDEEMGRALDALAQAQEEDGGWPVNWLIWTPVTRFEWRACVTVEALRTLRAYGRSP